MDNTISVIWLFMKIFSDVGMETEMYFWNLQFLLALAWCSSTSSLFNLWKGKYVCHAELHLCLTSFFPLLNGRFWPRRSLQPPPSLSPCTFAHKYFCIHVLCGMCCRYCLSVLLSLWMLISFVSGLQGLVFTNSNGTHICWATCCLLGLECPDCILEMLLWDGFLWLKLNASSCSLIWSIENRQILWSRVDLAALPNLSCLWGWKLASICIIIIFLKFCFFRLFCCKELSVVKCLR